MSSSRAGILSLSLLAVVVSNAAATPPIQMNERLVSGHLPVRATIVVLRSSGRDVGWRAAEEQIAAEFGALGLKVDVVKSKLGPVSERGRQHRTAELGELTARATEHRALAALRVTRSGRTKQIELWLHDRLTGKTTVRKTTLQLADRRAAAAVALQAVELVQASLVELAEAKVQRPEVQLDVPRLLRRFKRRTARRAERVSRWTGYLAPAVGVVSFEHPGLYLALGAARRLGQRYQLGLRLTLPLVQLNIEQREEQAQLWLYRAGVMGMVTFRPDRTLSFDAGLAAGTLLVHSAGATELSGRRAQVDLQLTASAELVWRVSWRARQNLLLYLEGSFGAALPPVRIDFGDDRVSRVDWLAGGALGAQLAW